MVDNIHIGTSGWSYKHWKEDFYPTGLKQPDWLRFYAKSFFVTEINTSFYRLPAMPTVINWTKKVPKSHPTWLEENSLNLLAKYKIGLVISQSADRFPYAEMVTAKNIYVRFHRCMPPHTAMGT